MIKNKIFVKVFSVFAVFILFPVLAQIDTKSVEGAVDITKGVLSHWDFLQGKFYEAQSTCGACRPKSSPAIEQFKVGRPLCDTVATASSYKKPCANFLQTDTCPSNIDETQFQAIYNMGTSDCYCCSTPSMCLSGKFRHAMTALRLAAVAGTVSSLSIQKHCKTMRNIQVAAATVDSVASAKCIAKNMSCRRNFQRCITVIGQTVDKCKVDLATEKAKVTPLPDRVVALGESIEKLGKWKTLFTSGKSKCGSIGSAALKQGAQAAANTFGAVISNRCANNDQTEDPPPGENDPPCSSVNMNTNPQACQDHCRENPDDPLCVDYCNKYDDEEVCRGVCNAFPLASRSFCGPVVCEDPESAACEAFCDEFPTHRECNNQPNCIDQPDAEGCDENPDIDCVSNPDHLVCGGQRTELPSLGVNELPPLPDPDGCNDPLGCDPPDGGLVRIPPKEDSTSTGSTTYRGASGSGGGGGGLSGGGGTGGGGAGGQYPEDAEMDGQEEEYGDLLSGLSPKEDSPGSGGGGWGFSGDNDKGSSGFDLSKFLPKNQKKKKITADQKNKKIAGPEDNIFNTLSDTVRVYCGNNQVNCNQPTNK